MPSHVHEAGCACHATSPRKSWWASALPAVACAACPACMAVWKPLLSVIGVTFALDDGTHASLLYASLAVALAVAAWDVWRSRLWLPFALTALGSLLLIASHAGGDVAILEWMGLAVLAASVASRWLVRARLRAAEQAS